MTLTEPFSRVYADALSGTPCQVSGIYPDQRMLPVHSWLEPASSSDRIVLDHCRGMTLDVGCGPGRMAAQLRLRGHRVLAVDIVREAVEHARERGVAAIRRNVFDPLPGEGSWDTVLLADGNIGIGGGPLALLRRTVQLLDPLGRVVCDLAGPGTGLQVRHGRLVSADRESRVFRWAQVGPEAIHAMAPAAGLRVHAVRRHEERWFAVLAR